MDDLRKKVAYLHGLADGLGVNDHSKEGRVLKEVLGVLSDMTESIRDTKVAQEELEEFVEAIDTDLTYLEDAVFEEDDELDEEPDTVICEQCGETVEVPESYWEADDPDEFELVCPECGATLPEPGERYIFVEEGEFPEEEEETAGRPD